MVPDERLKLLVIAHEEGHHEIARTPSVNVCSGHRRAGAEVLGELKCFLVYSCLSSSSHHASSIDMYNNDVGKKSAQKIMKQTGDLKAATLYFAS
jgi:hypothetical protein